MIQSEKEEGGERERRARRKEKVSEWGIGGRERERMRGRGRGGANRSRKGRRREGERTNDRCRRKHNMTRSSLYDKGELHFLPCGALLASLGFAFALCLAFRPFFALNSMTFVSYLLLFPTDIKSFLFLSLLSSAC